MTAHRRKLSHPLAFRQTTPLNCTVQRLQRPHCRPMALRYLQALSPSYVQRQYTRDHGLLGEGASGMSLDKSIFSAPDLYAN
jgi:hypothetical protein